MYEEKLDLATPITWASEEERNAAVAFFNAAFRAEESGLRQAHEIAAELEAKDPELAETLRLYGDEEGWHRELLTEFLAYIGGEVRPMGRVTRTFYKLYGRAKKMESIVLVNLMFETIGSTTYRMALSRVKHPTVRPMLTILTRDESFHVPLNVHFLKHAMEGRTTIERAKLRALYKIVFVALVASAYASRRRAKAFDRIEFKDLARAYAEHLAALFAREPDLGFTPPPFLLSLLGIDEAELATSEAARVTSIEEAARAVDRASTVVSA
ncbi:MAG TPA: ferritin-like domain-containing protein, partial [Polyangiaceae bacterium]|nr:ferritin-like domain-containing protein [Polyangiaceae bacterium]